MPLYYNVDQFIRSVLIDEQPDLSFYSDRQFCRSIKLQALEAIESILQQMQERHLLCEQNAVNFDLRTEAAKSDDKFNLSLLDFAMLAGIPELAYSFAAWGCPSNYDVANFKLILKTTFAKYAPPIVVDIQKALILSAYGKHAANETAIDNNESNTQLKQILKIMKKVAALLAMYDPPDPKIGTNLRIFDHKVVDSEPEPVKPMLFSYTRALVVPGKSLARDPGSRSPISAEPLSGMTFNLSFRARA